MTAEEQAIVEKLKADLAAAETAVKAWYLKLSTYTLLAAGAVVGFVIAKII